MKLPNWRQVVGCIVVLSAFSGVATWMFGDNVIPRAWDSTFGVAPSPVAPAPLIEPLVDTEKAPPADTPAAKTAPIATSLIARVCATNKLTVTFAAKSGDPKRFSRRAGATIIPTMLCNAEEGTFETRIDGDTYNDRPGLVAGKRIEFRYQYRDADGFAECRVAASEQGTRMIGTVTCEGLTEAMEARPAEIEIG